MTDLAARGVDFTYPNGTRVVEGWGAEFPAGAMTALTGASGSGKSTVLAVLGLLHRPSSGDVLVGERTTARLPDTRRAKLRAEAYGFVFQDAALDPTRTVLDNVVETALYAGRPRDEALARARELMERFEVGLRADHRPGQVSGGQAQRIGLCRALLWSPPLVLADEPTGSLDPATRDVVVTALREQAEAGACVVVASHDPVVVAACDAREHLVGLS